MWPKLCLKTPSSARERAVFRLTKTAKQAILALSPMELPMYIRTVRRKTSRSKPDRVFRQSLTQTAQRHNCCQRNRCQLGQATTRPTSILTHLATLHNTLAWSMCRAHNLLVVERQVVTCVQGINSRHSIAMSPGPGSVLELLREAIVRQQRGVLSLPKGRTIPCKETGGCTFDITHLAVCRAVCSTARRNWHSHEKRKTNRRR